MGMFFLGMLVAYASLFLVPIVFHILRSTLFTVGYLYGAWRSSKRIGEWKWTLWFRPVLYKWIFNVWWKDMNSSGRVTGCEYANGDRWEPYFKFYPKKEK